MKKIYKFLLMTIVVSSTMFYSCETFELENTVSPNGLSPDQADADLLLNTIQMNYVFSFENGFQGGFNNFPTQLARIDNFFGRNYFANLGPETLNGPWNNLYSGMIPDIANIEALNSADNDLSFHIGISKVMEAHILMLMVDSLGDIVWSEANNPIEFPNPKLDAGQDVYNAALGLLDEAINLLAGASSGSATDLFFDGDTDKWIKVANTLKMRADLTVGNYAAVLAATNVIESTDDDFEFGYGTDIVLPDNDNRHPDYIADYTDSGANIYQSNWIMQLMSGDSDEWYALEGSWEIGTDIVNQTEADPLPMTDPRRRYYFYRQSWNTPGNNALLYHSAAGTGVWPAFFGTTSENGETLQCSLQDTPTHLQFTPDEEIWCSVKLGYWGRGHGNDEGVPPDNFTRTSSGVYPAGGSFDNQFDIPFYQGGSGVVNLPHGAVGLGKGGGGFGIEPIILASYVDFMRAEASLATNDAAGAVAFMQSGMTKSINKVMSFSSVDADANSNLFPTSDEVTDYIAAIVDQFNTAAISTPLDGFGYPTAKDKMDILGEQYFIAMFGGASDAFNFIRRTGYPRTLSRSIEASPGAFPRTLLYPGNEIIANPNIQQRTDLNTKVFWDQGVTNPAN